MSEAVPFFVESGGHRLACLAHPAPGSELTPIVWIHGLTGSVRFWEAAMYAEIDGHRPWYSVSLPLHYPSTYRGRIAGDTLNEQLLADLIEAVARRVPGEKFHLAGFSVGAFAALNYAAKYPDRVASVISVGGFLTGHARGIEGVVRAVAHAGWAGRLLFGLAYRTMQAHQLFLKLATMAYARRWRELLSYPALDPTLRNIFPDVRRHSVSGQRAWFRYLLKMDLLGETQRIGCPVLVVAGTADPVIPFAHQRAYAALLPRGELLALPGVGHVSFAEAAGPFRRAVLRWLDKH